MGEGRRRRRSGGGRPLGAGEGRGRRGGARRATARSAREKVGGGAGIWRTGPAFCKSGYRTSADKGAVGRGFLFLSWISSLFLQTQHWIEELLEMAKSRQLPWCRIKCYKMLRSFATHILRNSSQPRKIQTAAAVQTLHTLKNGPRLVTKFKISNLSHQTEISSIKSRQNKKLIS